MAGDEVPYVIVNGGVYHAGTLVYTMFYAMKDKDALLDKVREHVLSDRAHAHCELRSLLEGED